MKKVTLTTKIFIGLFAGALLGLTMQGNPDIANTYIKPIGTLFLNMIKMLIVPLVFSSLVVGAASIGDPKTLGRIGGKTMLYYLLTTGIAIVIGLVLANIIKPGIGLAIPADLEANAAEVPSIMDTLLNLIPAAPLKSIVNGDILQIIVFALFMGIAATMLPKEKSKPFIDFFDSMYNCRVITTTK